MNKEEAIAFIHKLPDDEPIVVWCPRIRRKQRIESNGRLVFVIPKSQKKVIIEMFERVGKHIGSEGSETQWDWVISNILFCLLHGDKEER